MDAHALPRFRRTTPADLPHVYRVFRRSLFDYLHRIGQVDAETAADPPVEEAWASQGPWMDHLATTAAEDWVAEGTDGRIIGWAQSVERDGLLELTLFFVDPTVQSRGVGRGLLDRAFPIGRGSARTIVATQDPRALGLYLSYGVRYLTTSVDLLGRPSHVPVETDLTIEAVVPDDPMALAPLLGVERELLGHERVADVRFLLGDRPAWLARRGERVVGMAFGASGSNTGPIAALDPEDLPALLGTVESDAAVRGLEELAFAVPMVNVSAMAFLRGRGYRFDPFYTFILGSDERMRLDRWVHTGPAFIV